MAVVGVPGTGITATCVVGAAHTPATSADQAVTAQSIENDLATIKSGSYTTTAARTVAASGSDTFGTGTGTTYAAGSTVTGAAGNIASWQGRTVHRPRVVCADAAALLDVTEEIYVLPVGPAAQRLITLSSTIGPPQVGERIRVVCAALKYDASVPSPYQVTRNNGASNLPAGLLATIWTSSIYTRIPVWAEFQFAEGLAIHVTGTGSGAGGAVKLTLSVSAIWGLGAATDSFATGDQVVVAGVGGTTEANGTWTITVNDGTHITLTGTTFVHAWTSGGTAQITPGVWRMNGCSGVLFDNVIAGGYGVLPDAAS